MVQLYIRLLTGRFQVRILVAEPELGRAASKKEMRVGRSSGFVADALYWCAAYGVYPRCMPEPMIRKQVYLAREQDRKLKVLAARRGCTEAEIIREALDRLPDPDRSVDEQLAATGLLVPKGG